MDDPRSPAPDAPGDKPRLRPLEAFIDGDGGSASLTLRDPSGLAEGTVSLSRQGAAIIELCDGTLTRAELCAEFQRRYGSTLTRGALDALLQRLDDALFLDSPRFKSHTARVYAEFARQPERPAFFAGKSYPAEETALRAQLDACFAPPNGPGLPAADAHRRPDAPPPPQAIVAPHVDFRRGGPAYAWAYQPLLGARVLPELVVVLGTDHNGLDTGFTLTRKHFATPLGTMETDLALLDQLLGDVHAERPELAARLVRDEHRHRSEHSLEFQMVWLRHVQQRRNDAAPLRVLPVLCGPMHDFVHARGNALKDPMQEPAFGAFLQALRRRVEERRAAGQSVLLLAAADLAHVGPRYGDAEPLNPQDCDSLERRDRATLEPVVRGDADGWLQELRRERDRRRVCGLTPIYALLKTTSLVDAKGELRCYGQCQAEAGSIVSIASLVYS